MIYPESIRSIIKRCVERHKDSPEDAADEAYQDIRALDDYEEWVEQMVRQAVRGMVNDERHSNNTKLKRDMGFFGGPAKVGFATGVANKVAAFSCLNHFIGSATLGSILGKELPAIRDAQMAQGRGCFFNAALCSALIPLVPEDKAVRECVTENKARQLFKSVQSESMVDGMKGFVAPTGVLPSTNGHSHSPVSPTSTLRGRKPKAAKVAVAS